MKESIYERMKKYAMTGNQNNSLLSNTNQANGGILQNINPDLLLASELIGQGLKGNDPFSSFIPAFTSAAKAKSLMTPKFNKPSYVTFLSPDGKTKKTINVNNRLGAAQAKSLTDQNFTQFSQSVQAGSTSGLQKSVQTAQQKKISGGLVLLEDLNSIKNNWKPEYSSYKGKVKFEVLDKKDKAFPEKTTANERQFLQGYGNWNANSLQYFNRYRKEITGVAAGEKEIGYLKSSIPSDSDSPAVYQAKLDNQIKIQRRLNASAKEFLALGDKTLYETRINADGQEENIYSREYLDYIKKNKVQPTGGEIDNIIQGYKKSGKDFEDMRGFINLDYKGIDWENIWNKYQDERR